MVAARPSPERAAPRRGPLTIRRGGDVMKLSTVRHRIPVAPVATMAEGAMRAAEEDDRGHTGFHFEGDAGG